MDSTLPFVGLPSHPLLVHAVVVLIPLTALALVLAQASESLRRRLGIAPALAALVVVVLVPITVVAGEALLADVGPVPAVLAHEALGRLLLPWVLAMLVVAVVQLLWFRRWRDRMREASAGRARLVTWLVGVVTVGVAVGTTVMVVLIGDSGARAVWGWVAG